MESYWKSYDSLSLQLKNKFGVSDDVVKDVKENEFNLLKKEEKRQLQNRYVIMLKRIVSGKAKAEDFTKETKKNDHYSNSIMGNFLSDVLLHSHDKFINQRMMEYRSKVVSGYITDQLFYNLLYSLDSTKAAHTHMCSNDFMTTQESDRTTPQRHSSIQKIHKNSHVSI